MFTLINTILLIVLIVILSRKKLVIRYENENERKDNSYKKYHNK